MNRLEKKFKQLKKSKRKALSIFLTAGFPDFNSTEQIIKILEESGADLIELGVPFSDPIADGPTIQFSSEYALRKKVSLEKILMFVSRLRKITQIPVVLMSYLNPLMRIGLKNAVVKAKSAGVDGFIIPDVIPEEAGELRRLCVSNGLSLVFLAAPNTPAARLEFIDSKSKGFVYVVSLTGVTGKRANLPDSLKNFLDTTKKRIKKNARLVGFGISTKEQAESIGKNADGIIVGSALVDIIRKNKSSSVRNKKISQFVSGLRIGLD